MEEAEQYRIVVRGELSRKWIDWFDSLDIQISTGPDGAPLTTLSGPVTDQAALRGMLCKLWDLNLTLLSLSALGAAVAGAPPVRERSKSNATASGRNDGSGRNE